MAQPLAVVARGTVADIPDELLSPPRTGWPVTSTPKVTGMIRQWAADRQQWLAEHPGITHRDLDDEHLRRAREHQQAHPEDRGPTT